MPGRTFWGNDEYRYSTNGTEKSPEVASGHNSTYFRELDSRTGRWWSTDPVTFPHQSPYCTFDNNPVVHADPSGAAVGQVGPSSKSPSPYSSRSVAPSAMTRATTAVRSGIQRISDAIKSDPGAGGIFSKGIQNSPIHKQDDGFLTENFQDSYGNTIYTFDKEKRKGYFHGQLGASGPEEFKNPHSHWSRFYWGFGSWGGQFFYHGKEWEQAWRAYRHYRTGKGKDLQFELGEYFSEDPAGVALYNKIQADAQADVDRLFKDEAPGNYEMSTGWLSIGCFDTKKCYGDQPQTVEWQRTVGSFYIRIVAHVEKIDLIDDGSGRRGYKVALKIYAEDVYNFNPGSSDQSTGIKDKVNGWFQIEGTAHQFRHHGTSTMKLKFDSRGQRGDYDKGNYNLGF